jgi:hypothetical protein
MNWRSTLRKLIVVLGLATALIHLYLNVRLGSLDIPFTLNALGYLTLLVALFLPIKFLEGRERLVHYVFMAFTVVTILAWVALGDKADLLGWLDKAIEVLLVLALWRHLQLAK